MIGLNRGSIGIHTIEEKEMTMKRREKKESTKRGARMRR